jgi:D-alanyl-D-alanine carboxypeptidase
MNIMTPCHTRFISFTIRYVRLFCSSLVVCLAAGCAADQPPEWRLSDMLHAERQQYTAAHANWGGGMALYIVTPSGTHFTVSGFSPYDTTSPDTRFRAASITKTFTAAAVMSLHQSGAIDIDDVLTDFIPGTTTPYLPNEAIYSIPYRTHITIRDLLRNRGGVFDVSNQIIPDTVGAPYAGKYYLDYVREDLNNDTHTFSFDELAGIVSLHGLYNHLPDERFGYSNTGYMLLGKIIERVSGKRYHEFIADTFTAPLGLGRTSFPYLGTDMSIPGPYFPGHVWLADALTGATEDNMSGSVAEGNSISSLGDLALWIRKLLKGEAGVNAANVTQMKDCLPTGEFHQYYGLGITYTPGLGYGHNGGHQGYMTVMRYDPTYDITTVLVVCAINANDMQGQMEWMYRIVSKARGILGYPGLP